MCSGCGIGVQWTSLVTVICTEIDINLNRKFERLSDEVNAKLVLKAYDFTSELLSCIPLSY